jgi:hypothetical protein
MRRRLRQDNPVGGTVPPKSPSFSVLVLACNSAGVSNNRAVM